MKAKNLKFIAIIAIVLLAGFSLSCVSFSRGSLFNILIKSAPAFIKAFEDITPEQEYYIGRAVGANILGMYRIYDRDRELTLYLNKICRAITVNSQRPDIYNGYHLAILDSDEINAFATSGGHIFVTRGLIACAESEDALAGVIAHEVAHIQLQHGLKAIKNARMNQALIQTGSAAVSEALPLGELTNIFTESIGEVINTMVISGYSQTQEFEADVTAITLMAAAGYDPAGLMVMLRTLEKNYNPSGSGFGKTHPGPAQRIANAEKTLSSYKSDNSGQYRQARYSAIVK